MRADLIYAGRVNRTIRVITDDGAEHTVAYDGTGLGFERVLVDGEEVVRRASRLRMVPRFEFSVGREPAVIEIETGWVMDLFGPLFGRFRRFALLIDGELVYEDHGL